jgi:iron complex outermembrane receptor protein
MQTSKPRKVKAVFGAFALALMLTSFMAAQAPPGSATGAPQDLKKLSLEELSNVEVTTPSKEPTSAFRSPVAVFVITNEDIRRSGATTIPEALRLAPGVEVARIDGSKWSVGIRGFGTRLSRSVLVLMDGRTVYTPLFAGTYWEVQDTLLEVIERIEVIRGPGGTIWGPNAVDGVINIITKSTRETQGAYVNAGGGNEEQGFTNFRYGAGNGKGFAWRVYGKAYTRGPQYHYDHDNFDDWRGAQSGFRMDWTGGRDSFTLQGDIYRQQDGERVGLSTYTPPLTANVDGNAELSGGNFLARWTRTFSDGNDVQIQSYYDRTNRHEPNLGETRDTFDVDVVARTRAGSRQQFNYGLGARSSNGHFEEVASGLVFYPYNRLDYLVSAFFQDNISLVDSKLTLSAGSKVLRTNYTGFSFEPSVRLLWTPTERNTFWASYTHALRTPSDGEEDFYLSSYLGTSNGLLLYARFSPNKQFAPEQLNGYEVGYRTLAGKNFFIDFAGFWNNYHNLFSQDLAGPIGLETTLPFPENPAPPPHLLIPAQFRNDLYGITTGGEISPEWRPTDFWRLRGSYSFLNMNLSKIPGTALGATPASVVGSSPRHQVEAQSSFDIGKRLQLDLLYRYTSALPSQSVRSYSTGDVRAAWLFKSGLEFSIVGANLFQPRHVEYAGDPGLAVGIVRNVYASLSWRKK